MHRVIASVVFVAALVFCPGTMLAQGKKSISVPASRAPVLQKRPGKVSFHKKSFRKSITPSQPIEGMSFYGSSIGSKGPFRWIPAGTFQMGSTAATDPERNVDETPHTVTLTQGFWLLDHEVTQTEYQAVKGYNPSRVVGEDHPVEQVTWDDVVDFCNKLTRMDRELGRIAPNQEYRLPSEAEWEYACRAGTTGAVYVDFKDRNKELDWIAWWKGNSDNTSHPVKEKWQGANAFQLFDMIGNVCEWCFDWYGDYPSGAVTDPNGPSSGSYRVYRGGHWGIDAGDSRSALRAKGTQGLNFEGLGFRPALSAIR